MKEKYLDNHLQCDPPNPSLGIYQKEIKMYVHQKWVLNIHKTKIMPSGPITSWEIDGKHWKQCQTLFFGAPKSLQMISAMKLKDAYSLEGKL